MRGGRARRRRSAPPRAAAALLCCLALGAAAGAPACGSPRAGAGQSSPGSLGGATRPRGTAAEEALLTALGGAVEAREDAVARRLLLRLQGQRLSAPATEIADAYRRILDGRDLVRALELVLVVEPTDEGVRRVLLVAGSDLGRALELHTGPATLEVERLTVDALGRERVDRQATSFDTASDLDLPAAGVTVRELARTDATLAPGALAARLRWRLRMRAGELVDRGASYPAMNVLVEPAEEVLLAAPLDDRPVAAAELASAAAAGQLDRRAALALAVRVPLDAREEALDALRLVVEDLPLAAVERLAPALRWLAPEANVGGDGAAWRSWLRARASRSGPADTESDEPRGNARDDLDDRLDLPG